jgi:VanZ family protein
MAGEGLQSSANLRDPGPDASSDNGPLPLTVMSFLGILTYMFHVRVFRILTILVAVGILVLSLLPKPPEIPVGFHFADKIAHFLAYLVLGFFVFASVSGAKRIGSPLMMVLIVAALCALFGGVIEILQMFTGRQPEFWDLAADLIGAVCGAFSGAGLWRRFRRKQA